MAEANVLNPFFTVKREELYRSDGTDTSVDALYRADNGKQLSVVSRGYKLFTHREAVDFMHHALRDSGIEMDDVDSKVALVNDGAKMFYSLTFPKYRFNYSKETGIRNTALDGSPKLDDVVPVITMRNSYDKSTSLDFDGGGLRLVCKNGMMIRESMAKVKLYHYGDVSLEDIRFSFVENIVAVVDGLKRTYVKLNEQSGHDYATRFFIENLVAQKYLKEVEDRMSQFLSVDWEKEEDSRAKVPVAVNKKTEYSAWVLYCVLTEIATHATKSIMARRRMQQTIAESFSV